MKPVIVFLVGILFLIVGIWFYAMASNLSQLGPITFSTDTTTPNNPLVVASASGFKSYVGEKLTLVGEILIGIGALSWVWTPSRWRLVEGDCVTKG
jgi:hypothetical protein